MFGEENLARGEAFGKALNECGYLYFYVAVVLFAAAIVETATITIV